MVLVLNVHVYDIEEIQECDSINCYEWESKGKERKIERMETKGINV